MTALTIDPLPVIASRVRAAGDCLVWTGARDAKGYGFLKVQGRTRRVHRLVWELHRGPIPDGLMVLHKCDNPPCCKVDHLFIGTNVDNMADMVAKGRGGPPAGEKNPKAKLSDEQVRELRRAFAEGDVTCVELARRFGVERSGAWLLVTGRSRRSAGGPIPEISQ